MVEKCVHGFVAKYPYYTAENFLDSCQVCAHEFNLPRSRRVTMKASGVITVMAS
jgi:hypothetical protein